MRICLVIALIGSAVLAFPAKASSLVIWAWERSEDLRFVPQGTEVAAQTGFIVLSGATILTRGRQFPLRAPSGQPVTAFVHVQIDHRRAIAWSPEHARRVARAVLQFGAGDWVERLQIDFEVRASERPILLAVLREIRAGLPPGVAFSMTALSSWCETETWLDMAPVDEIVPMLFRMGPTGNRLQARLAAGGDFTNPRCRTALGISADTPIARAPAGRRVYLFNPRRWTSADFDLVKQGVDSW